MSFKKRFLKSADSIAGSMACTALSRAQKALEMRPLQEIEGPVVVIRPGGIGDAVMLLPMLRALREAFPERRIDIICETRNSKVFELAMPGSKTICYDKTPRVAMSTLRHGKYAAAIDTEQFHNFSAVMAALTKAPIIVGFKTNPRRRGLYTRLVDYCTTGPEDVQFMKLLWAAIGKGPDVPRLPSRFGILAGAALPDLPDSMAGVESAHALVVHAGGSIPEKRCPAGAMAEVCRAAKEEFGLQAIIIGGKEDVEYADEIAVLAGGSTHNICGKLKLEETVALCRQAVALVGPDSGIAHLAVAVGAPVVVLFGPSDPAKWGPPEGAGVSVTCQARCAPCSLFGYSKPCRNPECVLTVTGPQLVEALRTILENEKWKKRQ